MSTEAPETTTAPAGEAVPNPEPEVCGHLINLEKGPKPCQKPKGHDVPGTPLYEEWGKGHVSRIQTRKEYEPVNAKSLESFADVPDSVEVEYGAVGAGQQDRTKMFGGLQPTVDDHVKKSWEKWVAAGKPADFNKSPRSRYIFPPKEEDTFRAMLRAAARFHGISVKMPTRSSAHQGGKRILYWVAVDSKPRDNGTGSQAVEGEATAG